MSQVPLSGTPNVQLTSAEHFGHEQNDCGDLLDSFAALELDKEPRLENNAGALPAAQSNSVPAELTDALGALRISDLAENDASNRVLGDVDAPASITRFPTELLEHIFALAALSTPRIGPHDLLPVHPSFQISGVCQRWRSIALGMPALWEVVDLSDDAEATTLRARLVLSRSRSRELEVRVAHDMLVIANDLFGASRAFDRIRALDLWSPKTGLIPSAPDLGAEPLEVLLRCSTNVQTAFMSAKFLLRFGGFADWPPISFPCLESVHLYTMAVDPQSFDYTLRPPVPDLPRRRYPLLGKIALPQNARIVLHNDELSPYPVRLVDIRNFFRDDEPVKTVRSLRLVNIRTRDAFGGDLRFIRTMVESMPNISELAFVSCDEVNEFKQLSQGIVLLVYLHLEDLHRRSEGVPRPRAQAWPLLSTLTIHGTNISPQWLRQFLDIRAEIECPMRVLRLSAATVGNWREWELELLRKVVTVEVLDDSEGGFDGI